MSLTAHAAFDKACFYFNIEMRKVALKNFKLDLNDIISEIDENTIALVASAPDFPYGNFDNIPEFSKIA